MKKMQNILQDAPKIIDILSLHKVSMHFGKGTTLGNYIKLCDNWCYQQSCYLSKNNFTLTNPRPPLASLGYPRPSLVTLNYHRLPHVTHSYPKLPKIT